MVSIENGAFRLTCINPKNPGNLKLTFQTGEINHPVYGTGENFLGEIPFLQPQE